jgi:hypothetical protein
MYRWELPERARPRNHVQVPLTSANVRYGACGSQGKYGVLLGAEGFIVMKNTAASQKRSASVNEKEVKIEYLLF